MMSIFGQLKKKEKIIIFFLMFLLILLVFYRQLIVSYDSDPACKILSDEKILSFYERVNEYHQANPKNPIYAFIDFDFEYPLKDSAELIVYGSTGNIVPYKGKAKEQLRLVFEKQEVNGPFQSNISVRVFDKKSKALCIYSSEIGIELPNRKEGNKFLFKMTHPNDERQPMSSFDIIDLP